MQIENQYNKKKILITGATGFTGRILTEKLTKQGAIVHAIARPESNISKLPDSVIWHIGDLADKSFIESTCIDMHFVFHVAAAFREEKTNIEFFRDIHVRSTEYLINIANNKQTNPNFERFIHISTVGIHGHIEDDIADENYRPNPGDEYQQTKLEGENFLLEFAKQHPDFSFTIIRPAPIYGSNDKRLLKLFKMANSGFWIMLGNKDPYYHLIHVEDLTNVILKAGIMNEANREIFIAACDEPIKFTDLGKMIASKLGKKLHIIKLPLAPFYLIADICSAICKPFGIQPPIYRRRLSIYKNDRKFDNTKIREYLDYNFIFNNEAGIENTTVGYQRKGWLKKPSTI